MHSRDHSFSRCPGGLFSRSEGSRRRGHSCAGWLVWSRLQKRREEEKSCIILDSDIYGMSHCIHFDSHDDWELKKNDFDGCYFNVLISQMQCIWVRDGENTFECEHIFLSSVFYNCKFLKWICLHQQASC